MFPEFEVRQNVSYAMGLLPAIQGAAIWTVFTFEVAPNSI